MKRFSFLMLVGSMLMSLSSCGGGGGGGSTPDPIVLKANVQVLQDNDPRVITAATADTLTISGDASLLTPGTVLVSGKDQGYLREIVSVEPSGNQTILHTEAASLDDVFQSAKATRTVPIGSEQVAEFIPAGPGISWERSRAVPSRGEVSGSITLTLAEFKLEEEGLGSIAVSGDLSLSLGLRVDLELRPERTLIRTVFFGKAEAEVSLKAELKKSFLNKRVRLGTLKFGTLVFFVGPVPVVIEPTFNLFAVLDGSFKVGAKLTTALSVEAQLGVEYENGQTRAIHELHHDLDFKPDLSFFGSIAADFTPLYGELSILVYGQAGPYISVELPRFALTVTQETNPAGKRIEGSAEFRGAAGLKFKIFKRDVVDVEFAEALKASLQLLSLFKADNAGTAVGVG